MGVAAPGAAPPAHLLEIRKQLGESVEGKGPKIWSLVCTRDHHSSQLLSFWLDFLSAVWDNRGTKVHNIKPYISANLDPDSMFRQHCVPGFWVNQGLNCVIGPLDRQGPAATLGWHCAQMTWRPGMPLETIFLLNCYFLHTLHTLFWGADAAAVSRERGSVGGEDAAFPRPWGPPPPSLPSSGAHADSPSIWGRGCVSSRKRNHATYLMYGKESCGFEAPLSEHRRPPRLWLLCPISVLFELYNREGRAILFKAWTFCSNWSEAYSVLALFPF